MCRYRSVIFIEVYPRRLDTALTITLITSVKCKRGNQKATKHLYAIIEFCNTLI